ncbi:MAG: hypothetical protein A2W22_01550 [Candidatus Levybacteria bacterium RBG_16_35_11]|nr:MAG: hypothetical protein A2W22_01550 [Candidatus Levybacteria bacterium RBG_16_35_11]
MKIETSHSWEETISNVISNSTEIRISTLTLEEGEKTQPHSHKRPERIILPKSKVRILSEGLWIKVNTLEGEFTTVTIEPKDKHGLIAETPVTYFEVRTKARSR